MAYNPNIPQSTDILSQSQGDLLNNFQALQTLIDVNHVDFASGDQGKHKWVTFPQQGGNPNPPWLATEVALYNNVNGTTSVNELYVHKITGATTAEIPLTASILSTSSAPATNSGGWTYLPSGLLLYFGHSAGTGAVVVTPAGGPALTAILSVLVSPYLASAIDEDFAVRVSAVTATTFTAYISARTTTGADTGAFQYLVIGY